MRHLIVRNLARSAAESVLLDDVGAIAMAVGQFLFPATAG